MTTSFCITGTDTDAGKTVVTAALARLAGHRGLRVFVIKPVQTGASSGPGGLAAPDLERCARIAPGAATRVVALFAEACSPHLAARRAGKRLDAGRLAESVRNIAASAAPDIVILEGAGGLCTPLSESQSLADLFSSLGWPLLLVAANRLGCVNHALLSLEAARSRGLDCLGLVMNETTVAASALERDIRRDNSAIIARLGRAACLAQLPWLPGLDSPDETVSSPAWDELCARLNPALEAALAHQAGRSGRPDAPGSTLAYDRAHVWHPYASTTRPLPVWEAAGTQGARIRLRDGRELIDGMASWWCVIHGYRHPRLMQALREQAAVMPHVMFGGLTHEPAVRLARKLLAIAPRSLEQVFFADSGSVAVEVAIKMALQYQQATGAPQRTRLLTVRGGYHGDTFGAMGVCDPENGMHSLFTGMLPRQLFAPRPDCPFDAPYDPLVADAFARTLAEHAHSVAAVILEPIVQGAGGMWFYHPDYLRRVRALCREHGCLLILDEIATGFGRTGTMFACEHAGIEPDILCLGKGLTGGVMTLAATLASRAVAEGICAGDGLLMHGPTFMANPMACAVAGASLDLLEEGHWQKDVKGIAKALASGLGPCKGLEGVADVRVLGAIGVVEMRERVDAARLQAYFVEQGVWIRPFGRLIYVMPPYVSSDAEIAALTAAITSAVKKGLWR